MEIKAELIKPYTQEQRIKFIVENNHQKGYVIEETETSLRALADTEEEKQEKEKKRISILSLTAADVERGLYKALGKDFDDIIEALSLGEGLGEGQQIDIKALKIELKANNFYRGNPYVSQMGALLGLTEKQLDEFFETGDYIKLLKAEE